MLTPMMLFPRLMVFLSDDDDGISAAVREAAVILRPSRAWSILTRDNRAEGAPGDEKSERIYAIA
ncbi:hypothetical protein IscW_ISCW016246 [Ixodes scapularis]|uniref:Uncharacterized protein n=1 Tax=Ixodes scapularis TaxID=6945 RepID=B7P0Q0_IXOSC|nr:hypothetical protein IscW_ISCW016246 [Ixodes scapularis]|eukprot:XP_002399343.1 hypothetical protein IscW_ISCW016246 [Ixodes scapularis]